MFAVSSLRRLFSVLVLGLLTMTILSLTGCGEKEVVDPYVYDSVRRIMDGDTLSPGFLFEIDTPEIEYARGNTAMIRNGNLLNFLIYEDVENDARDLQGALLGVVKTFSPQPTHLVVQRIKRDGIVVRDSIPRPSSYVLPQLLRAGAVDLETPGAPLPEIGWKTRDIKDAAATFLPENEDDPLRPIQTGVEKFVYVPRHDLDEEAMANPSPEQYAWYAVFPEAALEIVDVTPGAEWMLHMMVEKDLPLIGSFSLKSLDDEYQTRKIEHEGLGHVVGTVKINWFKFGNTFVRGSALE